MKLSILIACYNEKATISKAIEEAKQLAIDKEIIVVDNCSSDGTRELLMNLKDNSLKIVLQPKNFGVGRSVQMGINRAKGEYFYSPCADLEYRMSDVHTMIRKLESENLDAVFGSRLLGKEHISRLRLIKDRPFWLGTIIATYLINKFYHRNFTDVIAPKLIKTPILKELGIKSDGQASEFELVSKLCKKGYKISEAPIYYNPRTHKEGKTIRVYDMIPALWVMIKVKFFC
ncbi:MAG: glycosyltransferase family 2 protein [Candidatus Omnitrophota bacterium]